MKKFIWTIFIILLLSVISHAQSARFACIGDFGVNNASEQNVANLVKSWGVDFVITTGDNNYGSTSIDNNIGKYYSQYIGDYTGGYGTGADTNKFFPAIGNHDYTDGAGINAYLNYFTLPGSAITTTNSSGNERYYDFIIGPVHFFIINSCYQEPDGVTPSSVQGQWLQTQLAQSTSAWQFVYFHHPPYSSASVHGSQVFMQWPFELWGADAVFSGHDHTYERIVRDDNNDNDSLVYFVSGLGGRTAYTFGTPIEGSMSRFNSANGSMLIEASGKQVKFWFYSVSQTDPIDYYQIGSCCAKRGDLNLDSTIDLVDIVIIVDYLFRNGNSPECYETADVNSNGKINISDITCLVFYVYYAYLGCLSPCN